MNGTDRTAKHGAFFIILTGICIGLLIKLFVIDVMKINGTSMEPSLKDGSVVVLNKLAYGIPKPFGDKLIVHWAEPEPGDVVIYLYQNRYVIKRCVGVADMPLEYHSNLEYTFETEHLYKMSVNGKEIPLTETQFHLIGMSRSVPEGTILAVGDNYTQSVDSRDYGFVPVENVIGKVLCR